MLKLGAGERTTRHVWRRRVAITPDRPFLTFEGRIWSYGQADEEIRRLAGGLRALDVELGTRVLVGVANSADGVFLHAALRELGAVLVTLLPGLSYEELAYQVDHSEAPVLICDSRVADEFLPHASKHPSLVHVIVGQDGVDLLRRHGPVPIVELDGYGEDSPAIITYTSGTTARPKGVVLPAGSSYSAGVGYAQALGLTEHDNFLLVFTLSHGPGAITSHAFTALTGGQMTIVDGFSVSRFWSQVERAQATQTLLFPAQLNLLLLSAGEHGPSGPTPLRRVISHTRADEFTRRFGVEISRVWGSTETAALGAGSLATAGEHVPHGYVGPPFEGVELAIGDPVSGAPLGLGETGEIWLRHPHVMSGYLKDEAATNGVVCDGWVRTGDLGRLVDGALVFSGRGKNVVKRSGENISPMEVEAVLAEHPSVLESVAFGVADPVRTEELAVVVAVRAGSEVAAPALAEFVGEHLVRWKVPRYILVTDEALPRLVNGKTDRRAAADLVNLSACWDQERAPATSQPQ